MSETDRERELIDRAQAGSVEAFDELLRRHQDGLYRFLLARGNRPADAEDVMQETFLAAFRHLGSYRDRWRFSTWLYTIAGRQALRQRPRPVEPVEPPRPTAEPDERAAEAQLRDGLWAHAREQLSDQQFSALWLYYAEDFEVAEIARVLRRSRPWVKVNLHRARGRLAAHLTDTGFMEGTVDEPIRS